MVVVGAVHVLLCLFVSRTERYNGDGQPRLLQSRLVLAQYSMAPLALYTSTRSQQGTQENANRKENGCDPAGSLKRQDDYK